MNVSVCLSALLAVAAVSAAPAAAEGMDHFPYGGWSANRFYYTPPAGFARGGAYSWYYGHPNGYPAVVTPSWPAGGNFTIGHFGGRSYLQYQPYSPFDASVTGGQASYGLNRFGMSELLRQATLQDLWAAGYLQGQADQRDARQAQRARVSLEIAPAEARLFLDGNPIGRAGDFNKLGSELRLPPGRYLLEASAPGHIPFATEIEPRIGDRFPVSQVLEPSAPGTPKPATGPTGFPGETLPARPRGKLYLQAAPSDAKVTLDGHFICFADMIADNAFFQHVFAGPHTLQVSAPGYESVRKEILISPLRPVKVEITLRKQ